MLFRRGALLCCLEGETNGAIGQYRAREQALRAGSQFRDGARRRIGADKQGRLRYSIEVPAEMESIRINCGRVR